MMKCNLYDDGTGVSFILRYPGMPRVHCISDALLSQIDVFPTLCDILNMEKTKLAFRQFFSTGDNR